MRPVPSVSEVIPLLLLKALAPTDVTVFERVTELIKVVCAVVAPTRLNAALPIDVTPSGITTEPAQVRVLVVTTLLTIANVPPPLQFTF